MNFRQIVSAASLTAVAAFLLVPSASAGTLTFNTNAPGTGFSGGSSLVLNNTSGQAATLTFTPNGNSMTGTPSFVNLGTFLLACPTCSTEAIGVGSTFGAFTFDLVITDVTDGAVGTFFGTSSGGSVHSDLSSISISWTPLQLGPGGAFGSTFFTTTPLTGIVAPNSGAIPGETTKQAFVSSTPEPATWGVLGVSMLGLGLLRRKLAIR
jgi:hypothetical protein